MPVATLDPDGHLGELEHLHRVASGRNLPAPAELYRRTASTVRVSSVGCRPSRDSAQRGHDDGIAMRIRLPNGHVHFSAGSGSSEATLDWLIDRVADARPPFGSDTESWDRRDPFRIDRDPVELPSVADARAWLDEAMERLGPTAEAWVEIATTLESWVAPEGRASRTRCRAWAFANPEPADPTQGALPPLVVAHRRWSDLPQDGWARLIADRALPRSDAHRLPSRCPVLFAPEAAATLVLALSRTLHGDPSAEGTPVGPAWKLVDDPTEDGALFGGAFDDARFATRRLTLADGHQIVGWTGGQGHYRRGSFRDEPTPISTQLIVEPSPQELPPLSVLVTHLRIHPLSRDRWILEFDGAILSEGLPQVRIRDGRIATRPLDLVARCIATFGPSQAYHQGVQTPALLFNDLGLDV